MIRPTMLWLVLSIALVSPAASHSQLGDEDFKAFWQKFREAVIKADKPAVAALVKFPLGMSYGIRRIKSKAELTRRYSEVFNQQTNAAECFARKEPEKDPTTHRKYSVACPDEAGNEVVIFEFERGSTGWRFVRLDNLNE